METRKSEGVTMKNQEASAGKLNLSYRHHGNGESRTRWKTEQFIGGTGNCVKGKKRCSLGEGQEVHRSYLSSKRANPDEETTDWRAVCGRTARTVRREGRAGALLYPITNSGVAPCSPSFREKGWG